MYRVDITLTDGEKFTYVCDRFLLDEGESRFEAMLEGFFAGSGMVEINLPKQSVAQIYVEKFPEGEEDE